MIKKLGNATIGFSTTPHIIGHASVVSKKESTGPIGKEFDKVVYDMYFGKQTWEQAESEMIRQAFSLALEKSNCKSEDIGFLFAGDLLNQCVGSTYGLKDYKIPYLGQYSACSTMVQSLIMAALMVDSGAAMYSGCATSSHFCSAERQYRLPLDYGGQRPPTAQWTVTGAGACIVSGDKNASAPYVESATVGQIVDMGVNDQNNMGAAMAPAAVDTLMRFFSDTSTCVDDYDAIFTGDLGVIGSKLFCNLLKKEGIDIESKHKDCGVIIYNSEDLDTHSGGSGCGCCASVLCSHILNSLTQGRYHSVLVMATGALLSPTSIMQSQTIPCIAHLVHIKA